MTQGDRVTRRRTSRPVRNPEPKKGFPWRKTKRVYHATIAMSRVLEEGLKARKDIGTGDVNALGGGPSESISFTTDLRVAQAVAIGLRTLVLAARRELKLGDLIVGLQPLAPQGTAEQIRSMQLTPEAVVRIDEGLVPVSSGMGSWQHTVRMSEFEKHRGAILDIEERSAAGATAPFFAKGWARPELVERMQRAHETRERLLDTGLDWYGPRRAFEFYKYMLSYADFAKELYNPLFMSTEPEFMSTVDPNEVGIVEAELAVDWLCAEEKDAQEMGFDTSQERFPWGADVVHACEGAMRYDWQHGSRPAGWARADPKDTVVYLRSLSEIRVYDPSVITRLQLTDDAETLVEQVQEAWARAGHRVENPLAHPWFKNRQPQMV